MMFIIGRRGRRFISVSVSIKDAIIERVFHNVTHGKLLKRRLLVTLDAAYNRHHSNVRPYSSSCRRSLLVGLPVNPYEAMSLQPSSVLQLTLLGNGHRGSPKSLSVRTDHSTYLFNCGEGTQKSFTEFTSGMSKIENVFFTGKSWEHVGGSVGLLLTLRDTMPIHAGILLGKGDRKILKDNIDADVERPDQRNVKLGRSRLLTFHGPSQVGRLLPFFKDCELDGSVTEQGKIQFVQADPDATSWKDDAVSVQYVPLRGSDGEIESFAYVLDAIPLKPRLDMFKAMQMGIPKGPLLGKLVNGESITLEDGRVIAAEEVTLPRLPSGSLVIVECAHKSMVSSLVNHPAFRDIKSPAVVVHLSNDDLLADDDYVEWANSLEAVDAHCIVSPVAGGLPGVTAYRHQLKLNRVDPFVYPLLPDQRDDRIAPPPNPFRIHKSILCQTGFHLTIRPYEDATSLTGEPRRVKYNADEVREDVREAAPDLEGVLADMKTKINDTGIDRSETVFPHVVFLGTSSAIPLKERNVTGIIVRVNPNTSILLDCGESTRSQLRRHYGDDVDDIFRSIKFVFLSHRHTDHHLGLNGLLRDWRRAWGIQQPSSRTLDVGNEESSNRSSTATETESDGTMSNSSPRQRSRSPSNSPPSPGRSSRPHLFIVAPKNVVEMLYNLQRECEPDLLRGTRIIFAQSLHKSLEDSRAIQRVTGMDVKVCAVEHCAQAMAISLRHVSGWRLSYSGDCRPSSAFAQLGRNSDVLIHEASMGDDLVREAECKKHSTVSEAIRVGKEMRAKTILLTHFSGRYAKIPVLPKDPGLLSNVGLASDFAVFSFLRDAPIIPQLTRPLQCLFNKDLEDLEVRGRNYLLRLEDKIYEGRRRKELEANVSNGGAKTKSNNNKKRDQNDGDEVVAKKVKSSAT